MTAILSLEGVSKSFGAVVIADNLNLALAEGEVLGMLGPNGAGKTTLFGLITGMLAPNAGRILFEGSDITRIAAAQRCRMGIARSFQIPRPFGDMTVLEMTSTSCTRGTSVITSFAMVSVAPLPRPA